MKPVSGSNRASKAFAQTVFEQLYENQNLRVACAQILSDCIFIAHQISPSCWSLTLFSDGVRLNVGPVEVVVLTSEEVFLVISDAENHRFAGKILDSFITPSELHFPSVPVNQRLCYIPSDKIPRLYPLIAKPHKSFVRRAAERRKKTTWSKSFSPGVIDYLNDLLDTDLPMPSYFDDKQKLTVLQEIEQFKSSYETLSETTRQAIIESRIGQGKFKKALIRYWKECSVTGCKQIELLRASHIKPWRFSSNKERLDPDNGLLLIPNLDACFDLGLISFEDSGGILISSQLDKVTLSQLGIRSSMKLSHVDQKHKDYLSFHRKSVFRP